MEKKKLTFKDFWNEIVVPTVKEWLPDILKFFFKNWGAVLLATTTIISTGGYIYEKNAYDTLRGSVDNAQSTALSELDRIKAQLESVNSDLKDARRDLAESTGIVERQRNIIQNLQDTNRRLQELYSLLNSTGGAIEAGERTVAELIERSLRLNRELQDKIGRLGQ